MTAVYWSAAASLSLSRAACLRAPRNRMQLSAIGCQVISLSTHALFNDRDATTANARLSKVTVDAMGT
eukprot:2728045-Lingulodinium_polyedra.AAC.1